MPSTKKSLLSNIGQEESCLGHAVAKHVNHRKVSFYTPGHKGYSWQSDGSFAGDYSLARDLSESVPDMDDLACPSGVISRLEKRAAQVWGAHSSLISVNGATAGILASILFLAKRGTHILVPRNCHRSVISGLVLSGLEPIWYEPIWQGEWGFWGAPDIETIASAIENFKLSSGDSSDKCIAGLIVTSPTYAGALANLRELSSLLDEYDIPLIVDEAHGAHLQWTSNSEQAALNAGVDIVVHSLHKTLSCMTQIGLLHISQKGRNKYEFSGNELRACMNLIQSSSPSYIFMQSVDQLVSAFEKGQAQLRLREVEELAQKLRQSLAKKSEWQVYQSNYGVNPLYLLVRHKLISAQLLQEKLADKGIYTEAILGNGLLLFFGIGSQENDVEYLLDCLAGIEEQMLEETKENKMVETALKPLLTEQVYSPRKAFYMPSHIVPVSEAIGSIASECFAPCPPGWPVLIPGQRVNKEILEVKSIESVRVMKCEK